MRGSPVLGQAGHPAARMLLAKGDAVGYAESDKGYFFNFGFVVEKKRKGLTLPLSQHATSTHQGLCQRLQVSRKKRINMQLSHAIVVDVVCPMKGEDG